MPANAGVPLGHAEGRSVAQLACGCRRARQRSRVLIDRLLDSERRQPSPPSLAIAFRRKHAWLRLVAGRSLVVLSGRLELSRIRARIRRNAALSWRAARARHPVAVRLVREAPAIPTRPGEARGRSDSAGDPAHPRGRARQPEAEARLARRSRLSSPSLRRRVGLAGPATRSDPWSGWRSRSRSTPF